MLARRMAAVVLLAGAVFGSAIVASAQGAVSRSQRMAVVFVAPLDSTGMSALDRGLYDSVELAAYGGARAILSPAYGRVFVSEGSVATLSNLRSQLSSATNRVEMRAVDLIFVTHGATSQVFFADGPRSMATVRDTLLNGLTATQRAKLRMVFSTACFGATHRASWIAAGFDVASGARGIYADSAASYVPFLSAWALGQSFNSAIAVANGIDFFRVTDNLAKAYYNSKNQGDLAVLVDSVRVKSGDTGLTVDGNPVGRFGLSPVKAAVGLGQRTTYDFSWTVPKPGNWRTLTSMGLRLRDGNDTAIAMRWDQASNTLQLVDGKDRRLGSRKRVGGPGSLKGPAATLDLGRTGSFGRGRTARLSLPLSINGPSASGRTFRVQVRADEDGGAKAPWQEAGTVSLR